MKPLSASEEDALALAKTWADNGQFQGAFIVLQALWKKHSTDQKLFLSFLEIFEELDFIKAYTVLGNILSGDEKWQELYSSKNGSELAFLFQKHGLMALKLKDEAMALEQLKRSASLGGDSLLLWATLAYLFALSKDVTLAVNALWRALELYKEPSLFELSFIFLKKNYCQKSIDDELFLNVCLSLFSQIQPKEARKLLGRVKATFPDRPWVQELQEIVAQEDENVPIDSSLC